MPHLESRLYAFYSLSLTTYCMDLQPRSPMISFGCHPQPYFSHHAGAKESDNTDESDGTEENDGTKEPDKHHRRIPDFAALITSNIGIVHDSLVFWVEVKPLNTGATTNESKSVQDIADGIVSDSIIQVNEQALFSFRHFDGDIHYAFLMVGAYFTLLEYSRPANLTPYVQPVNPAPTTRHHKQGKKGIPTNIYEDLGNPAFIESEVLYFNQRVFIDRVTGFSPLFLRALAAVAESSTKILQDFERPVIFSQSPEPRQPPELRVSFILFCSILMYLNFWC